MRLSVIRLIAARETRDLLRDRRTVLLILVLPLVVYPLFGVAGFVIAKSTTEQKTIIGVVGMANLLAINDANGMGKAYPPLVKGTEFVDSTKLEEPSLDTTAMASGSAAPPSTGPIVLVELDDSGELALREKRVDCVLTVPETFAADLLANRKPTLKIDERDADEKSKLAAKRLTGLLRSWEQQARAVRFARSNLPADFDKIITLQDSNEAKPKLKRTADELRDNFVRIFPFILMMWLVAGAIQPAVDLTAGEKERGTMETLLISPAERVEIVIGKFLAVTFFSFASVAWNVVWLTIGAIVLENLLGFPILNLPGLVGCVILGLPLAMFFSAICVALGIFARSTKEGQYYLMPLILFTMPLAFWSMIPGTELTPFTAVVPVTGAMLLQQKLLSVSSDPTPWGYFLPVLGSLSVAVVLALSFAVWQFRRESVLFREAATSKFGRFARLFGG